ncbi:MAG: hypothetical protein U0271_04965 [Polyangiaceae bacterium]
MGTPSLDPMFATRRQVMIAVAVGALVGASCGRPEPSETGVLVDNMVDISSELRDRVQDHERSALSITDAGLRADFEADEAEDMLALHDQLVRALYALESCAKEGRYSQTPFLSELAGRIESAILAHAHWASPREAAFVETMNGLLDELDKHLEVLRAEVGARPLPNQPCPMPMR